MLAGVLLVADFCHGEAMNAEVRLLRREKRDLRVISCASTELTPLAGGGWRYTLPKANLPPADVVEIAVPFLTARKGDAGFWVLPDGRMGAFTRDNGECRIRNCRIPLPFAGFKSPRGSWMAIVRGLRFQCDFGVAATNGLYELVTRFHLADLARPAYENGVVEFVPLKPGADGLADMARLYREERLARGDVKPLAERVKGNKELAYTAE